MAIYRTHQIDRVAFSTRAIRGAGGICSVANWLLRRPSAFSEALAQMAGAFLASVGVMRQTPWAPAVSVMSLEPAGSMDHGQHQARQPARVA